MKTQHNYLCHFLLVTVASFFLLSCHSSTDDLPLPYDSGVVVINEGGFGKGNGSLSFLMRDSQTTIYDIFKKENNLPLGDIVQSYTEFEGKGFVVVNNSNKVEVVDARSFKSLATLTKNLTQPRFVSIAAGKLYVACWDKFNADYTFKKGWVTVVDLTTFQTIKTIQVGKGPEQLMTIGNEVFVANSDENFVSVINTQSDAITTIAVPNNPTQIVKDTNGKIWVLCKGKFGEKSQVVRVNPQTKMVEASMEVGSHASKKAGNLSVDSFGKTIFFTYNFYDEADGYKYKGEVYSFSISDMSITADKPFVSRPFYGLGIDPQTNMVYGALAPSFSQSGYVYRYKPTGQLVDSVKVEIGPNGFFFK